MNLKTENTIVSNIPKSIQIANIVRRQILNGYLAAGDRLHSDAELAGQYQVHRHTVAEGLRILGQEGLLERAPRRGSIVTGKHKKPVYLLIPCPGYLDENSNTAIFLRRLHKYLHLQLMGRGISVITVPMSPTNNPDDILEEYFDIIPSGGKVVCTSEWGLEGLSCLKKKNADVVFYDLHNYELTKQNKLIDKKWAKINFDRSSGVYKAIRELSRNGFTKPLLIFSRSETKHEPWLSSTIKAMEKARTEYYPDLPQENILWYELSKNQNDFLYDIENFAAKFKEFVQGLEYDSIFFANAELGRVALKTIKDRTRWGIISNSTTEIISAPELCHYTIDCEELAKITIELFIQPDGTERTIKPKLYNVNTLKILAEVI